MLNIINKDANIDLEFDGIKIINTDNPTLFYKEYFINNEIIINDKRIKSDDIVYINNLTKMYEFINLNKKSYLMELISDKLLNESIIKYDVILNIINDINTLLGIELLEANEGDKLKLINLYFDLINDMYLNEKILTIILKHIFVDSKLIIFDNVEWVNIEILSNYLNEHNFIILTNNFVKYIKNINELEIVTIHNKNFIDILDVNKLCWYLQTKINNQIIEKENLLILLNKNDQLANLLLFFIQTL